MKRPDSIPDRRIADALRRVDPDPYDRSVEALAARIDTAAAPLLAARRFRARAPRAWWEYAAGWAKMLIPIGVTVAVASVVLWVNAARVTMDTVARDPVRGLMVGAVGTGVTRREFVDLAVEDIVGAPRSLLPAGPRR